MYYKILRQYFLPYRNKVECLLLSVTSTLVYYLQARLELTRVEPLTGLNNNDSTRVGVSDISKHANLLRYGHYY